MNGNRVRRSFICVQRKDERWSKSQVRGTQPMHEKETKRGMRIELGGARPMREEEIEGGMNIESKETQPTQRGDQ